MQIHLHPEIFEQVVNGTNNVEARVNDEKRRKLKVGDIITVLKRPDEIETLNVRVTALKYFKTFTEIVENTVSNAYIPLITPSKNILIFSEFFIQTKKYPSMAWLQSSLN